MADDQEKEAIPTQHAEGEEEEITPGYKPPAKKTLEEIQGLDTDDTSLVEYKRKLLGSVDNVLDEGGNNVIVRSFSVVPLEHDKISFDLTGDLTKLKSSPAVIKEGASYRVEIKFRVQREIVAGLRYNQVCYRKGIQVEKGSLMVGSYGPKTEEHIYLTPVDEAPKGMLGRGHYTLKSKFVDDDKNILLQWEWAIEIKKDWSG